jgi:UDP-GlcNAc3NAcA epimerase
MKLVTIIGARPQFIKAAAVSRAVAVRGDIREVIVHTGQHYDANMSDIFFEELAIPRPDHHLGIGGGTHGAMTGRQLEAIERVLLEEKPDMVLVYGDTNSTLAGALAAVKLHIPVAHVEAGLRSFNRRMPEEINRILTDHASDLLFTPTDTATQNLRSEGLPDERVWQVGDVMYDAALFYHDRARMPDWFSAAQVQEGYVLATLHRAENVDDPHRLRSILNGLEQGERDVILPLHPRTRKTVAELGLTFPRNVRLVDPVGYLEMVWLIENCSVILTDSGGLQKEAFFLGKPCITARDETEWQETLEVGANVLVGADETQIAQLLSTTTGLQHGFRQGIFGNGDAASALVRKLGIG